MRRVADAANEIRTLDAQREDGLLTEDQFTAQKDRLLGRQ
jgi:hypothetical protein